MNNVNINDSQFEKTLIYQNFIKDNPGSGRLNIRASYANGALPLANLEIIISKIVGNYNVIFFDGLTNSSGNIEDIKLPTPPKNTNDLEIPRTTTYLVTAVYNNVNHQYRINMYDDICAVQNINFVPTDTRGNYGY